MQILKRKSIQSPRDLICIFIGAELENVVNGEYAQEWCFCFVYDFQHLSSRSTPILVFRMKNINKILDKLLIANLSTIVANTDSLYLTLDKMMLGSDLWRSHRSQSRSDKSVAHWPWDWSDVTCAHVSSFYLDMKPDTEGWKLHNACLDVAGVCSDSASDIKIGRRQGLWHRADRAGVLSWEKWHWPQSWQIEECYLLQGLGKKYFPVSAQINNVYFRGYTIYFNVWHFTFSVEIIEEEQISSWSLKYKESYQIHSNKIVT